MTVPSGAGTSRDRPHSWSTIGPSGGKPAARSRRSISSSGSSAMKLSATPTRPFPLAAVAASCKPRSPPLPPTRPNARNATEPARSDRAPRKSVPPRRGRARNESGEPSTRGAGFRALEVGEERYFDQPRQRHLLVDRRVLDASDEKRRQVHVELLLLVNRLILRHHLMLAS